MTEKRFRVEKQTFDGYCIVDNHFDRYYAYEKQDLEKLCETLNDLSEENEQLQKKNDNLVDMIARVQYRADSIKDENEELKKEVKQLKNKIKTYNSTHELLKETIDRLRSDG